MTDGSYSSASQVEETKVLDAARYSLPRNVSSVGLPRRCFEHSRFDNHDTPQYNHNTYNDCAKSGLESSRAGEMSESLLLSFHIYSLADWTNTIRIIVWHFTWHSRYTSNEKITRNTAIVRVASYGVHFGILDDVCTFPVKNLNRATTSCRCPDTWIVQEMSANLAYFQKFFDAKLQSYTRNCL